MTLWTVARQAFFTDMQINTIHLLLNVRVEELTHTVVICNPQTNSPGVCVVLSHLESESFDLPRVYPTEVLGAAFRLF